MSKSYPDRSVPSHDDDTFEIVTPGRPPIAMKGLLIELCPTRSHPQCWPFGDVDTMLNSAMIARTTGGEVVATDADALFPDFEHDPDHDRLVRYLDVADAESFVIDAATESPIDGREVVIDGFVLERPTVANQRTADAFPADRLRIWPVGEEWNGITLLENAVADGLIDEAIARTLLAAAEAAFR